MAELGDFILTPCGPIFRPIEAGLGMIEPGYRKLTPPPIHMGVVVKEGNPPIIFEGYWPKARLVPLTVHSSYRVVQWLSEIPDQRHVDEFVRTRLNARYDLACYFWTILARGLRLPVPRISDRLFTCWEVAADFALWCGEPWHDMYTWPLITDFLKATRII